MYFAMERMRRIVARVSKSVERTEVMLMRRMQAA
jgi:hypothetical protein